jgi:hypothetical protein
MMGREKRKLVSRESLRGSGTEENFVEHEIKR